MICTPAGSVTDLSAGLDRDACSPGIGGSNARVGSAGMHHAVPGVAAGPLPPLHRSHGTSETQTDMCKQSLSGSASLPFVPQNAVAAKSGSCSVKDEAVQACSDEVAKQHGVEDEAAWGNESTSGEEEGDVVTTTPSLGSTMQVSVAAQPGANSGQFSTQPRGNRLSSAGVRADTAVIRSDDDLLPDAGGAGTELSRDSSLQKRSKQDRQTHNREDGNKQQGALQEVEASFHHDGSVSPTMQPLVDTADSAGNPQSAGSTHVTKLVSTAPNPISNAQLFASYQQQCGSRPKSARDHQLAASTTSRQHPQQGSRSGSGPRGTTECGLANVFVQDLIASRASLPGSSTPASLKFPSSAVVLSGSVRVPRSTPGSARVPPTTPRSPLLVPPLALSAKSIEDWSEEDVAAWMTSKFPVHSEFLALLKRHAISGPVLLTLTDTDLNEMGIERFGHRRLLRLAAQEVRAQWSAQQPQLMAEPVAVMCGSKLPHAVRQSNSAVHLTNAQQLHSQTSVVTNSLFPQPTFSTCPSGTSLSSFQQTPRRAGQVATPATNAALASMGQPLRLQSAACSATSLTPRDTLTPRHAAQVRCASNMTLVAPLASATLLAGSSGAATPRVPVQDSKSRGRHRSPEDDGRIMAHEVKLGKRTASNPSRKEPSEPIAQNISVAHSSQQWKSRQQLILPPQQVVSCAATSPLSARFTNTEVPDTDQGACVRQFLPPRLGSRSGPSLPVGHHAAQADDLKLGSKVVQPVQPQQQYSGPAFMVGCQVRKCISSEPEPEAGSLIREA